MKNPFKVLRDCLCGILQMNEKLRSIRECHYETCKCSRTVVKILRLSWSGLVGFSFQLTEGNDVMGTLILNLEKAKDSDVLVGGKRMLSYSINGGTPTSVDLPGDAEQSSPIACELNDRITGSLQNVDSSSNPAPVSLFDLTIDRDNVPPSASNVVGFSFDAASSPPV